MRAYLDIDLTKKSQITIPKETAIFKLEGNQNLISLHTIDKETFYDDDGKEIDTKEVINRVTKLNQLKYRNEVRH